MNIKEFSAELKMRSLAPKNIEFSSWHNWTFVSSFNELNTKFISESVSMGIDKNPEIALMKSLTEFCESYIFRTSIDPAVKITTRSDGFAAYPSNVPDFQNRARNNAYNEAVERYLWATWWDNDEIAFSIEEIKLEEDEILKKEFELTNIYTIKVETENSDISLKILLAKNNDGGYVTGGAAGNDYEINQTNSRAFGELLRHLLVIKKMKNQMMSGLSFYEQRLWGFASGDWKDLVLSRLNSKSERTITLPSLIIDKEVIHKDSDLVCTHRCLFKDQPIFMGGNLERLCI